MNRQLLRDIPQVDQLLQDPAMAGQPLAGTAAMTQAVRRVLETLRQDILAGQCSAIPDSAALCARAAALCAQSAAPSLRRVINGTGVTLHTNLGRACLSEAAAQAARDAGAGYSTLEYDVDTGARGLRYTHVSGLLRELTGAQDALVVNNNAAAVLLLLSGLAAGGEVIVSRGELVEIGGSFRVPDIMEACGCRLREVGTTNKTHLADYEAAIGPDTRALLKVHTSNFRIVGFTETPDLAALTRLGHSRGLPVLEDLGSGALTDLGALGIPGEPTVQASVRAGVDVVTFSGDKLLGGPQAGLLVGRADLIGQLARHPLTRAMRVDKLTLAALEATLRSYRDGTALTDLPVLRMLCADAGALKARAEALCARLRELGAEAEPLPSQNPVGGGAAPTRLLDGWCAAVAVPGLTADGLEQALRRRQTPIVGRIQQDRYLLELRTLADGDFDQILLAVGEAMA